ncbi:MAG: S-methyl-5-thioribose-1-phosphate isomerase, partial [Cyanobacteria bacterium REEB65]|nr:S-methyl-5-thioribose-1-phosphate isomerase [Cyanobacteria bacterium REEB65]
QHHRIPFYIAAPVSTFDPETPDGDGIPLEQRSPDEITHIGGQRIVAEGAKVYNPAFDVTPNALLRGILTERGIVRPPYTEAISRLFGRLAASS